MKKNEKKWIFFWFFDVNLDKNTGCNGLYQKKMRKWHTFGKNGEKWPKSRKNCQIGHQSGNFAAISLSGGRSEARMNQIRAYNRIGTFPETVGGWKMGVNGEKWGENGQKVEKMAKMATILAILRLSSSPLAFLLQCEINYVSRL